jgi:hypothetical protein
MENTYVINSSYYCERSKPSGPIIVLTTGAYAVAEYDERTGDAKWKRVVQANQKAIIERWLSQHFPPKVSALKAKEPGK